MSLQGQIRSAPACLGQRPPNTMKKSSARIADELLEIACGLVGKSEAIRGHRFCTLFLHKSHEVFLRLLSTEWSQLWNVAGGVVKKISSQRQGLRFSTVLPSICLAQAKPRVQLPAPQTTKSTEENIEGHRNTEQKLWPASPILEG